MERILIKISGESIGGENNILDAAKLKKVALEISKLTKQYSVSIVLGAGNIWRGAKDSGLEIARTISDGLGMTGTVINGVALAEVLNNMGLKTLVFSPWKVGTFTHDIDFRCINEWLNIEKQIAIFAGGTGNPFFTTDSGAALRAAEIGAKWIVMCKNGVDGVYSDDPKINKKAIFYDHLTYDDVFKQKLRVMDLTALTLCMENKIKIKVCNASVENGISNAMSGKNKSTIIE